MGIRSQNNPIAAYLDVFSNTGTDALKPGGPSSSLTATGGNSTNNYTSNGQNYKAHIFTTPGSFVVSELSSNIAGGNNVEYVVVAGGGGGGSYGGGGAGGYRSCLLYTSDAADE